MGLNMFLAMELSVAKSIYSLQYKNIVKVDFYLAESRVKFLGL